MGKNILIIDSHKEILESIEVFLNNDGHDASCASSAEKGLAQARKTEFDLILLDIMLPDNDNLTILTNLMKIVPNIPIIIVTDESSADIAEECLKNGAIDYITKPFDFEYLRTAIMANMLGS